MMKMNTVWRREDIPYDAMGDYSVFDFEPDEPEEMEREVQECEDQDRSADLKAEKP